MSLAGAMAATEAMAAGDAAMGAGGDTTAAGAATATAGGVAAMGVGDEATAAMEAGVTDGVVECELDAPNSFREVS